MSRAHPPRPDAGAELSVLIQSLQESERRLEELTEGQVDVLTDGQGRSFYLRRAQDQLRKGEAVKQVAIIDALPAHIVMLDMQGNILLVNQAWRRFAAANGLRDADYGTGRNYLELCESARGDNCFEAPLVAAGIRSVLSGAAENFSIEYPCHSPAEQRWFHLTVTPLAGEPPTGAVIMHVNVSAERLSKESLRASESLFLQMAENIRDVFYLVDANVNHILYVSPAYEEIWGRSCASLYARADSWLEAIHPDDRKATLQKFRAARGSGHYKFEYRIVRPNGSIRWIQVRGFPVRDAAGKFVRIAGIARDITEAKEAAILLNESEGRLNDLLQHVELASVMLDLRGQITFCNEYLLELTGRRQEQVVGRNWYELFATDRNRHEQREYAKMLADAPARWSRDSEIITRGGERRLMRWHNSVLRSGTGAVTGSASIGEDITDRNHSEARIAYLNRVYATLSGINSLIVRVHDRDELFKEACRVAVDKGGFLIAMVGLLDPLTQRIVTVALAGKNETHVQAMNDAVTTLDGGPTPMVGQAIREKRAIVCNDSEIDPSVVFSKVHTTFGVRSQAILPLIVADRAVGVLALYANERHFFHEEEMKLLTDLAGDIGFAIDHLEKGEKLNYLAFYDALTGLANRTLFLERVAQFTHSAVSVGRGLALFVIDLVGFKNINDSLGRPAGDALLRQVADWMKRNVGQANLLTRVEADHFAVVLPDMRPDDDLAQILEQKLEAFQNHAFRLDDSLLRINAKVGAALFPRDGATADVLFQNAEAALKKAKASGNRYLIYTQTMNDAVAGRLTLESQLRQAVERKEFELHYQPKVSLADGRLVGAEALIRWNDPLTGQEPPARFIPVLEETGLIYEVGEWALRKAIDDHLRWLNAGGPAVRIAVNVSPLQLRNREFVALIKEIVAVDPRAAAGLELEITESIIMEDVKNSIASLTAIREMGIRIAIDDFGTGFSSLSYLSKLPVDTIKIDRAFVVDMTTGPQGLALVSTIIRLAHALKLKVVAEGVETGEQRQLLRLLNCDEMQGVLFSRPVPADVFETKFLSLPAAA